ncbi:MAG: hypothetical protein KDC27_21165 [Acidobacteria bacterium]|nr:hypothetical protein [Acidobacteriota bacterium]
MEVRAELDPRSPVIALAPLGAQVNIVGRRRKLVRVQVGPEQEGWAREEELISYDVKRRLEILTERAKVFTPQGELRAFDDLNVHLEPYRWSPTVYRMNADEGAELLHRKRVVRREEGDFTMPPDSPREDWYLVRLPTGVAGWVLASRTYSAIPIEVAQYAEGRRILAYFGLSPVTDDLTGESKQTWLWVQSPRERREYDFDRIRVFRWSNHRDAYQTIRLERGVEGYLPVIQLPQVESEKGTGPGFRLTVGREGRLEERTYVLLGQRVYLAKEGPAEAPPRIEERVALPEPMQVKPPSLSERLLTWLPSLF